MPDVSLVQSVSNNGTVTPATPGSLTLTNHNLAILIVAVLGTSPTINTPAGWTQIQKTSGASLSFAMYAFPNQAGGATNPSATLGGTVTGWICSMFEFNQTGANCGIQGSLMQTSAVAQLTNIFASQVGQTISNLLFIYSVARTTATITSQNTGLAPFNGGSSWSNTIQSQQGIQGLSVDTYWGSNLAQGVGAWPGASGLLSAAVASVAIAVWFNTTAQNTQFGVNIIGGEGIVIGPNYQGMIGG